MIAAMARERVKGRLRSFTGKRMLHEPGMECSTRSPDLRTTPVKRRVVAHHRQTAGTEIKEAMVLAKHFTGLSVGKMGIGAVRQSELPADFNSRNANPAS